MSIDHVISLAALPDAPPEVDVLIVGLGPVGAAAANLLGRYGVRVLAVDAATEIFSAPRAIALDNEALRILQLAGLSESDFEKVAIPRVRMKSPLVGEFGRINTLGSIDGHPKLVTFYQPELERCLRRRLEQYGNVCVALGVTLKALTEDDDAVVVSLERDDGQTYCVRARYVIGADGARSLVRRLIGRDFEGRTFKQDWLIVDAQNVPQPIDHIEFLCDHRRPTPHMVAPGGRERWEFMLRRDESPQEMEREETLLRLLKPWAPPDRIAVERSAVYRFHARVASAFSRGRVFLAGDAAHVTPPFVGQGLVSGLRDAANLCWKLAWVVQGRASRQILESYDVERRPHARAMIRMARIMGSLVMPRNALVALLAHGSMRALTTVPYLRRYFEQLGIKPKNSFRQGLFIRGTSAAKFRRGAVLPQGWVRAADGSICLSDDVLGPGLALVGFGVDPRDALREETARAFEAAGGTIVAIAHRGQRPNGSRDRCWEDLDGIFLPRAAPFGWAAVVRPDKTILNDGPSGQADRLVRESLTLLGIEREVSAVKLTTPQPARHPHPTAKATALSHLVFDRPDLSAAEDFLTDFGLRRVASDNEGLFFRGTESAPFCYIVRKADRARFAGFGLRVGSLDDLESLARLPGASNVQPLNWPGGGYCVRLVDPSGFRVDVVAGQTSAEALPRRAPLPFNSADTAPRINATQRLRFEPAEIVRLGHVVLEVADYQATCAWYTQHFGFIPSDVLVLPDGSPAVAFMRLNLGAAPADHHTLALVQGFAPMYSHSAYELVDADAVGMGQRVLRAKGWSHAWGIGRHILGSQIFDYWQDPWGDKHEHYCDGDLFTEDQPTGVHAVSREAMAQWGQPMPRSFTQPRMTPSNVAALIRNLWRSPDLNVAKLGTLAKIFG
jgi:3-(3-hydroxy-phenyl)propionate hydroxylase